MSTLEEYLQLVIRILDRWDEFRDHWDDPERPTTQAEFHQLLSAILSRPPDEEARGVVSVILRWHPSIRNPRNEDLKFQLRVLRERVCVHTTVVSSGSAGTRQEVRETKAANAIILQPAAKRLHGFPPDMARHKKIAAAAEPFGNNWKEDNNLKKIAGQLDKARVPVPKNWYTHNIPHRDRARTWKTAVLVFDELVVKAISYSLGKVNPKDLVVPAS